MMPRFFLITNDAARCALELWCHPGNLPPSIGIADDFDSMMRVPDGGFFLCFWYGSRAATEPWENCWWSRRIKGGVAPIDTGDWDTICDWALRARKAPTLRLLLGVDIADEIDRPITTPDGQEAATRAAAPSITAPEEVSPPAPAIIDPNSHSGKRAPKWT